MFNKCEDLALYSVFISFLYRLWNIFGLTEEALKSTQKIKRSEWLIHRFSNLYAEITKINQLLVVALIGKCHCGGHFFLIFWTKQKKKHQQINQKHKHELAEDEEASDVTFECESTTDSRVLSAILNAGM